MSKIVNPKTGEVRDYPGATLGGAVLSYFNENYVYWIEYDNVARLLSDMWENRSYYEKVSLRNILMQYPNLFEAASQDRVLAILINSHLFVGTQNEDDQSLWNAVLNSVFPNLKVTS